METTTRSIDVEKMCRTVDEGKFCFSTTVQRESGQWDSKQQSLLIDSILRSYKIPAIWITRTQMKDFVKSTVIDGSQRIHAIYDFIHDKYKLHKSIEPITVKASEFNGLKEDETYTLAGKTFTKLPKAVRDIILDYVIDEFEMFDYTEEQITQQFARLNNGRTFTNAQKANTALGSDAAEKVHKLEKMDFWNRTGFSKAQRKHAEITSCIIQCFMLLKQEGCANLSAGSVENYAAEFGKTAENEDFEHLEKLITALDKCLPDTEENTKFLKKIHIPALIYCTDTFLNFEEKGMITSEQYTKFLSDFIEKGAKRSGYLDYCGVGSQSSLKVEKRVEIIHSWLI